MKLIYLLLLLFVNNTNALNILGIFPYEGKSHFLVFRVYLRELAKRGHNVTVISHFPEPNPQPNYHDISLAGTLKIREDDHAVENSYWTVISVAFFIANSGKENCEVLLANKQVQDLIKSKPKFDVIVLEQFNSDCAFGVAYKLGAPVVGMSSHILMPFHYKRLGIPNNPSYVPFHFLEGGTKPSLFHRVERVVFDLFFKSVYYLISQRGNQNTLAKYFDDIPPLEELAKNMKFHLLYHNFILTGSRLFPSNVIEVGGYHVNDAKPLTGELKNFVDDTELGIIYISFGSVIKSASLSSDKVEMMLDVMNKLPYRFIWKWEDKTLIPDKNKLYLSSWLPQTDILGHPKTVAFLSHAGMAGITEAIHFGVPVIAMPFLGDQPANAADVEESGLGIQLQYRDLTAESLLKSFQTVLDPLFREKVKKVAKAWHDRPMPPLDTAIYWTEFAARNPDFNFRTAAADTPLYQYLLLDVTLVFLTLLVFILIVLQQMKKSDPVRMKKTNAKRKTKKT